MLCRICCDAFIVLFVLIRYSALHYMFFIALRLNKFDNNFSNNIFKSSNFVSWNLNRVNNETCVIVTTYANITFIKYCNRHGLAHKSMFLNVKFAFKCHI